MMPVRRLSAPTPTLAGVQPLIRIDIDPSTVAGVVGAAAYSRGSRYARDGAVLSTSWNDFEGALCGSVRGSGGTIYTTIAYFSSGRRGRKILDFGDCTCPVGGDCKHVAALVLAGAGSAAPRTVRPQKPTWEASIGAMLDSRPHSSGANQGRTPIAIELSLQPALGARTRSAQPAGPALRLMARLVRPGRNGWAAGDLSWGRLPTLSYHNHYRDDQMRFLQELYAVFRSGRPQSSYYSYSDEKSIELSAFESRQLWSLLDEAKSLGVRLVHGRKRLGDVDECGTADLRLDVTRTDADGPLVVTSVVRVDGSEAEAVPLGFIGGTAHGLVYIERAPELSDDPTYWRFRLARLSRPVPATLQRMALENERLVVPAADAAHFRDEYIPRVRQVAEVFSSDGSFTPPAISEPTLVLQASYGAGHDLRIDWGWRYEVGESTLSTPLVPDDDSGFRDVAAERALLANLDLPLDSFGLRAIDDDGTDPHRMLAAGAELGGIDTMRFSTEVLPLLAGRPGVAVEVNGDPTEYREAGDSLRIAVSTAEIAGETDWFDLGVSITVADQEIPFADVFVALATDQTHMLLDDGTYFSLQKPELRTLRGLIEEARALQEQPDDTLRISRFQVGLWDELAELGIVDRQAEAWRKQTEALKSIGTIGVQEPPSMLHAQLRPYQKDGFDWLGFLWTHRLGGILADDMGLGKTLQTLALICQATQDGTATSPFLIVAPTSVVSNWAAEAKRFAPDLDVLAISDTVQRRGDALEDIIAGVDVVVLSYTLFRIDFDTYSQMPWSGLILDEAQFVKNHQSKAYQCARRLVAPFKLAITGTPMENNLMELWSLLSITAPGLFPNPSRFRDYYGRPIEKQGDAELLAQLRRRVKPLVKRRTKEQVVADLPAKQEQVLEVDLHPRHRKTYQTRLQRERQKILGLIHDMNRNRFTILRSLTVLRQLSLHAGLVDDKHHDMPCAKLDALVEQLHDVIDGGHRALVFSQFTGFLDLVRARLDAAGIAYSYLDGKTRSRGAVLTRFKEGSAPVFLISLKAGGFGLNLAEADYCFLLDPWWNPATEAQAVDRIHRIGQTRNVMVYRLIAKDTIEEKVMALKARKSALFSSVMDDGDMFGTTLDADDIRGLLAY